MQEGQTMKNKELMDIWVRDKEKEKEEEKGS